MARWLLFGIILLLSCADATASNLINPYIFGTASPYADILFHHNFDDWSTTPSKGSGTVSFVDFTSQLTDTTTKLAGTGSLDTNADGYGKMYLPTSGNFDINNARVGFWIHLNVAPSATYKLIGSSLNSVNTVSNDFVLYLLADHTLKVFYRGGVGGISTATLENAGSYYVEVSLNNNTAIVYVDGVQVISYTNASPAATTLNQLYFFSETTMLDSLWDQLIISNSYLRDLNAIKTITNFN